MSKERTRKLLWAAAGVWLALALGGYGGQIAGGERGAFVMNFPATGAECGGPSMRELTGSISVSLSKQGFLKRAVQPHVIDIAGHVVRNIGDTPREISFEASGFPETTEYESRDRAWNPTTHTIERPIPPGQSVDFGLLVRLPESVPATGPIVDGAIVIRDVATGETLSELPVRIFATGDGSGGSCCE